MLGSRENNARLQSNFYQQQYRRTIKWIMFALVVIFFLLSFLTYLILFQRGAVYYANTTEGLILPMPKVESPHAQ